MEEERETVKGVLVTVWGDAAVIDIEQGKTLEAMQVLTADGGCVTCVGSVDRIDGVNVDLWLDDEGLLKAGAQMNRLATEAAGQQLVGNALVLGSNDEGECVSVPHEVAVRLLTSAREWHAVQPTAEHDVFAGAISVAGAASMAGEWWPTAEDRLEMARHGGFSVGAPLVVPAPVVVPLTDESFSQWLETGEVPTV
jgi:hypothetical protein